MNEGTHRRSMRNGGSEGPEALQCRRNRVQLLAESPSDASELATGLRDEVRHRLRSELEHQVNHLCLPLRPWRAGLIWLWKGASLLPGSWFQL